VAAIDKAQGEASSARLPLPDLARLNEAQQAVAKEVSAGPRGEVRGPVRVWLHSPELANRAQKLGEFLRWGTVLDPRISELVILVTARHYNCHFIWFNHVKLALKGGLDEQAVESIKNRRKPNLVKPDEQAAYSFTIEVLRDNAVTDATLARVKELFGDRGTVEIGAIIAHYHSGAIALGLADISLPDGSKTCLPL
jgi:4-carboxymuconolactone decarboxylase